MTEEKERPEPSPDEDQSSPGQGATDRGATVEEPPRNRGKSEAASFSPPGATLLGDTSSPNPAPFESWVKELRDCDEKLLPEVLSILRR